MEKETIEQYLKSELLGIMPNNKIIEMADNLYKQTKHLTEQFEDVKNKNLELQEQLAEKEKEIERLKRRIIALEKQMAENM